MSLSKFSSRSLPSFAKNMAGVILFVIGGISSQAHAQLSVSDGRPIYRVPIVVPPGINNMFPKLLLEFDAGAGTNGLGWAIKGASQITRCPSNKMIDGVDHGVDFSPSDRLCLDGQRLIQTDANGAVQATQQNDSLGGTGTAAIREYRTDTDSYARIRAYGAAGNDVANGPAYFKVWTKSGQIIEFGNNSNASAGAQITAQGSSVVVAWPVSRISDLTGNFVDFQYSQRDFSSGSAVNGTVVPGHAWNLTEIRYTGNGAQAPANKVTFEYVERTGQDRSEAYQHGAKMVGVWMLSKVKTFASTVPVKTVVLTYEIGAVSHRSRPKSISECSGADETRCLPKTTFNYATDTASSFSVSRNFKPSVLASLPLSVTNNTAGVILGNFFANGRTDILRWTDDPTKNEIYYSVGDGGFDWRGSVVSGINLFRSDGCYYSIPADFNGDGVTDILRLTNPAPGCPAVDNVLLIATGRGTFSSPFHIANSLIDFTQKKSTLTTYTRCANYTGRICDDNIYEPDGSSSRTEGRNFYLIDVNNDGLLDILTTVLPAYARTFNPPSDAALCAQTACTHLYVQQPDGTFVERPTNLAGSSVYTEPAGPNSIYWSRPNLADVNGDKLVDLVVDSGVWISRGDGNFDLSANVGYAPSCPFPIDFNGDGRTDCLSSSASGVTSQTLYVADGTTMRIASNFNLTQPGQELNGFQQVSPTSVAQVAGAQIGDVDGDGRADIIRWKDDPSQNAVFLSNGDGTFSPAASWGLAGVPLQKSDGSYSFLLGDFTGHGGVEILRLKRDATGGSDDTSNLLLVNASKDGSSLFSPPDQLASIRTGTGLTTSLTWIPLSNSSSGAAGTRYSSDKLQSDLYATYPVVDLNFPMYVVATVTTDNATGSMKRVTEYSYTGLKGAYDGRGLLGFREIRQQNSAPNSEVLTTVTQFLQTGLYVGKSSLSMIRRGSLKDDSAPLLSSVTNIYCDTTSSTPDGQGAASNSPCATSAKVRRPYLYQSIADAWDLNKVQLPRVVTSNSVNANGDLTKVVVSKVGTPAGLPQQTTVQTVSNSYYPDNTQGDTWMLGQVQRSVVTNSVTNSIDSITTTAPAPQPIPASPTPTPAPVPVSAWLPTIMSLLMDD